MPVPHFTGKMPVPHFTGRMPVPQARRLRYNPGVNDELLLAIETSSSRGSVALGRGEPTLNDRARFRTRSVSEGPCRTRSVSEGSEGSEGPCRGELTLNDRARPCDSEEPRASARADLRSPSRPKIAHGHAASRTLTAERKHTGELLPALRDLLAEAGCRPRDVGCVCFSQGPGSFTGLRVAATVARMWQSAVGCRVIAVPSLEVIARNALSCLHHPARLAVILDARRGKLFGALFERDRDGELRTLADAALHEAAPWLAALEKPCWVLGEGVVKHAQTVAVAGLEALPEETWLPDARQVLAIGRRLAAAGRFCTPAQIVPAYLRPPECEEVYEQRRAAARQRRGE